MKRRFSIPVTKRSFARNKIPPRIAYDSPSDDVFNLETDFVLAKMRTMTPEEAAAFSAQAVAEAEVAMIEAADAMWEAAAAEAQAAAAVRKEMKARKHRKMASLVRISHVFCFLIFAFTLSIGPTCRIRR